MNQKLLLILAAAMLVVGASVAFRTLFPAAAGTTASTPPTPLPVVSAPDARTSGPTPTPMPAPDPGVALVAADAAREIGSRSVMGVVEDGSVSVTLARAGDYSYFAFFVSDYPVWVWTGEGRFQPAFGGPPGVPQREFTSATVFIDAVEGIPIRRQLRGEIDGGGVVSPN